MARMSIYVPDDLKGRMDRLNDKVNWSGVAQAAFESEIQRNPEWTEDKMTNVIERLRASKTNSSKGAEEEGFKAGREWAEQYAEFIELKQLAASELDETFDGEEDDLGLVPRSASGDEDAIEAEFWEGAVGDDWHKRVDGHFQIGFYRGAMAVWEEVEQKL